MDAELKRKWVEALRSGAYRQTCGGLHSENGYCCLGVLAEAGLGATWRPHPDYPYRFVPSEGASSDVNAADCHLDDTVYVRLGLLKDGEDFHQSLAYKVARMNDDGASFQMIADYIEKHL